MKSKILSLIYITVAAVGGLTISGCAGTSVSTLVQDASGVISTAAATASDIFTVAAAVEQNNTGKPVTIASIVSDAQEAATSLNSSNLASTAQAFASSVQKTIADAQAAGESQAQVQATVTAQTSAAQVAAAQVASSSSPTASVYWHPGSSSHFQFLIVKDSKNRPILHPRALTLFRKEDCLTA